MSSKGLSPHGHLCDGRLHLVLVHASSRLQYLRFLSSIPQEGMLLTTPPYKSCCFSMAALIHFKVIAQEREHIPAAISSDGAYPILSAEFALVAFIPQRDALCAAPLCSGLI